MKIGVMTFPTHIGTPPDELGRAVEGHGFEVLLFAEHTHVPLESSDRPRGGQIPEDYHRVLDPFIALTAAALSTTRLRIGTGIFLAAQRDPIVIAKATGTLDHLSGGRLIFGVGFGWNGPEMANHGMDPAHRRAITREHLLAVRRLWEDEVAEFHGKYVEISPSWMEPKPCQRPGPPVFLGADAGPGAFGHLAEWADGWYPSRHFDTIEESIAQLRAAWAAAGRDPDLVQVMACAGDPNAPGAGAVVDFELLDRFAAAGVSCTILPVPPGAFDRQGPVLETYATAIARYHG